MCQFLHCFLRSRPYEIAAVNERPGNRLSAPARVETEIDRRHHPYYLLEMALRSLITVPDPRLRLVSAPVAAVDDSIRALMDDMLETMYAAPGVGLAAIQIGVPKRVI